MEEKSMTRNHGGGSIGRRHFSQNEGFVKIVGAICCNKMKITLGVLEQAARKGYLTTPFNFFSRLTAGNLYLTYQ